FDRLVTALPGQRDGHDAGHRLDQAEVEIKVLLGHAGRFRIILRYGRRRRSLVAWRARRGNALLRGDRDIGDRAAPALAAFGDAAIVGDEAVVLLGDDLTLDRHQGLALFDHGFADVIGRADAFLVFPHGRGVEPGTASRSAPVTLQFRDAPFQAVFL